MQGDNHHQHQEGCARVRHVPIHVESRDDNVRGNQRPLNEKNRGENNFHHRGHEYQNQHYESHTLPNTSSININYNPQQQANFADNNSSQSEQAPHKQTQGKKRTNNHEEREQSSPDKLSSSQEKPISPPGVIPLPPPPKSPEPNSARDTSKSSDMPGQQQSQQPSQQSQQRQQQQNFKPDERKPKDVFTCISEVKSSVTNLLKEISNFSGTSAKSKEYRYLDEMLTRCVLNLDQIECGDSVELRQHRKAAIKLVDRATDILQRKLKINSDIHELSENMTASS